MCVGRQWYTEEAVLVQSILISAVLDYLYLVEGVFGPEVRQPIGAPRLAGLSVAREWSPHGSRSLPSPAMRAAHRSLREALPASAASCTALCLMPMGRHNERARHHEHPGYFRAKPLSSGPVRRF